MFKAIKFYLLVRGTNRFKSPSAGLYEAFWVV